MKEKVLYVINKLKEISSIKHVDMYYNQDENLGNLIKFPACLVGIGGIQFDKDSQFSYQTNIKLGILLFHSIVKPSQEKELEALDLIESIYDKFKDDYQIELKTATALERTSTLSAYYIEIDVKKEV